MSITSADVCLVTMPYAEVVRPSIALGLLQASLQGSGIRAEAVYGNLDFAARIGLQHYRVISATAADHLLGEWTFAGALFGDRPGDEDYLERILGLGCRGISTDPAECKAIVRAIRDRAGAYLDELAASILARRPRIVGCSSMFQQHCASLALLARIRDLDPEVVTLMGGANCEGEMGEATLAAFPWVDLVVSGEADSLFPALCRQLLEQGRQADPAAFPYGVLARRQGAEEAAAADGAPPSRSIIRDLDALPIPEYDDYFTALETTGLDSRIEPGLPVESSRGCWWGEKSHCTFCGLNGIGMGYRTKSAGRVHAELAELSRRHGVRHFEFVDNILDMAHIQTLLPGLAAEDEPYTLFYETKANLRREQLQTLAAAGVRWIQPGIESLHDSVLGLIGKGNSALMNLQLLKWSRELGIRLSWNLLSGFPGESDDWYLEVADWLPHIFHLQPPSGIFNVRYDRFSPYHNRPADFGIELAPAAAYGDVYPLPADTLRRLAYYFEDAGRPRHRHRGLAATPGQLVLKRLLSQWEQCWSHGATPQLRLVDEGHCLRLFDTRPGALSPRWTLDGLAMDIYRLCDSAQAPEALGQKLSAHHARSISPQEVEARVDGLCKAGLLLRWHGKLFALAVAGQPRALPSDLNFPGGHVVPPRPVAQAATAG
jgi:magnesium-protoporphyrin IX monomethyl ester (oxidative) cyclase